MLALEAVMKIVVRQVVLVACVASSVPLAWSPAEAGRAERQRGREAREEARGESDLQRTERRLGREVREALRGERDLRRIDVSVQGGEATLTGRVPTFWAKRQAIERALEVDGVETVASELELPEAEDDNDIAEEISKVVQRYPHYTLWDHVTGRVNGGQVLLGGWVTPDRDKRNDLFERVAKIKGVQDVQSSIETLPPSQSDQRVRVAILRQLAFDPHFERLARMANPPFRIVVRNGAVLLVGYVQGQVERMAMQQIVAQTHGVLRVENRLEKLR